MAEAGPAADLYLNLLKRVLVRWGEDKIIPLRGNGFARRLIKHAFAARGFEICQIKPFNAEVRMAGRDWPDGLTVIGVKRMENIQHCVMTVLREGIPGDLVEAGLWRGGASIFMRAILAAFGDEARCVWCADSFAGWPLPDAEKYPLDAGSLLHLQSHRAPSLQKVKENFQNHALLDERVRFLAGWFAETLPCAPIGRIAVLRLDADMYGSTMDVLNAVYPKMSPGGFVILNDYGVPESAARSAVDDFRNRLGIHEPMIDIDGSGAFWRLQKDVLF